MIGEIGHAMVMKIALNLQLAIALKAISEGVFHVVLDNLNTHKPKCDRWLQRHPNVHFHFTPTYSSWLNQIECWFSILSRSALKGASFTAAVQVRDPIDRFVRVYNEDAVPFEWRKTFVRATKPAFKFAQLRK